MKSSTFFLLLLSVLCPSFYGQTLLNGSLEHDEQTREYLIYLPADFDSEQTYPMVIDMHGLGSNNGQQFLYSAFGPIADTAGFIVVYPQGLEVSLNGQQATHWNAGFGTGVDDLGFIDKLIDQMFSDYPIDLSRVYATGMSNGGFMSYTLSCQLSDRIAAMASVAGAMTFGEIANCNADRPIPVMQIHGTADGTVPFNGTPLLNPSIPDVVDFWVQRNGCSSTADTTNIPDIDQTDQSTATLYTYSSCDSSTEVQFYVITNGGHSWPGAFPIPGLNPTNQDFSASHAIWEFFAEYNHPNPRPGTILSDESEGLTQQIDIFPNPFENVVQIEASFPNIQQLQILDLQGRLIWQSKEELSGQKIRIAAKYWPEGLYVLRVETDRGIISKKLLKSR